MASDDGYAASYERQALEEGWGEPDATRGQFSSGPRWAATAKEDAEAHALYVTLTPLPVYATVAVNGSVNVDYDITGEPVGVEILLPGANAEQAPKGDGQ